MANPSQIKFLHELVAMIGVQINGPNPWDVQIHNDAVYDLVLRDRNLGLGEAYMKKWWDCQQLDEFACRALKADLNSKIKKNFKLLFHFFLARFVNFQTKKRSLIVAKTHYDLGNDLFQMMLDSRMNYSCGYWRNAANLEEAQLAKLELVCKKLNLEPGMTLLDVGCGWGGLVKYAAENYGVKAVGITLSRQQYEYAKNNCHGLPIEIRLQDYRDITGQFDRIASIGMFEHVGPLNYNIFMKKMSESLNDDGLFLLHTIASDITSYKADEWLTKYIFPNSTAPSIQQIGKAIEGLFVMEDWHNFGADYSKTLMAWYENFNKNWTNIQNKSKLDETFYRMWRYYLLSSAGLFRARTEQLWQIVFSKTGVPGGYLRIN